jgi:hypothetical protein
VCIGVCVCVCVCVCVYVRGGVGGKGACQYLAPPACMGPPSFSVIPPTRYSTPSRSKDGTTTAARPAGAAMGKTCRAAAAALLKLPVLAAKKHGRDAATAVLEPWGHTIVRVCVCLACVREEAGVEGRRLCPRAHAPPCRSSRWLARQDRDPYVRQARAEHWRSRAAVKLVQLDDAHRFLRPGLGVVRHPCACAPSLGTGWRLLRRVCVCVCVCVCT